MLKMRMRAAVALSRRLPAEVDRHAAVRRHDLGRPALLLVRELIQDVFSIYGLPRPVANALEADRQSRGLEWRQYLIELLSTRYRELVLLSPNARRPQRHHGR